MIVDAVSEAVAKAGGLGIADVLAKSMAEHLHGVDALPGKTVIDGSGREAQPNYIGKPAYNEPCRAFRGRKNLTSRVGGSSRSQN